MNFHQSVYAGTAKFDGQENVIRGGLRAVGRDANGRRRRTTSRAVNGIDQDVKLNKALWTLSARLAELVG